MNTAVDPYLVLKDQYEPRVLAMLERMAARLRRARLRVDEPVDLCGDDYCWGFSVHGAVDIDVSFRICESEQYDGTENGVNFAVDVLERGGAVVGGLCPYNFTDLAWVDLGDEGAVEDRFHLVEQHCCDGLVDLVVRHLRRAKRDAAKNDG